jgi:hypothetical protein
MKRYQQVRLLSDPTRYGQISWVDDTPEMPETGPKWPIHVQWAGFNGDVTGHMLHEVRPETFTEFCLQRGLSFGKAGHGLVLVWLLMFGATLAAIYHDWLAAGLLVAVLGLFTLGTWLNFKGWIR